MPEYLLPFHQALTVEDVLGILDEESEGSKASQGTILIKLLEDAVTAIVEAPASASTVVLELLDNIAYIIHGNGNLDTETLEQFLAKFRHEINVAQIVQNILQHALYLTESSCPSVIRQLTRDDTKLSFSSSLSSALLAHQALGTLRVPTGNDWGIPGFLSWYASPGHPQAKEGYLRTLFSYFEQVNTIELGCTFELFYVDQIPDPSTSDSRPKFEVRVVDEIIEPIDAEEGITPFVLVAANNQPGPGPTGTQEERIQAASPVLTLSSLICPVIPDDAAIVTSAVPVLASWTGHNRSARLVHMYNGHERPSRYFTLADALTLDGIEVDEGVLPDLLTGNVVREIRKLYTGFLGARRQAESEDCFEFIVEAPPWGCGAFGGSLLVKALCMMVAAGLSDVKVRLTIVRNDRHKEFETLKAFANMNLTVAQI